MTHPEKPKRKPVPLSLLVGVFLLSFAVVGALVFVVVSAIVDAPAAPRLTVGDAQPIGPRSIEPPQPVLDFTLPTHTGAELTLSQLRGQPVLLYFGYTSCPDVCLLTLDDVKTVYADLGAAADEVAYLFVSVDPARDTAEKMARHFDMRQAPFMTGLIGDAGTLRRITPDYNLFYELNDDADQNGFYTVNHTANLYLLDARGRLTTVFPYSTHPDDIVAAIEALLAT